MQSKQSREKTAPGASPFKLLLWTAIVGLIFGVIGFGEPLEDALRVGRNALHPHAASGDIVLIAVDDRSLQEVGNWPWSRKTHARMISQLAEMGARRTFYDVNFAFKSDPAEDAAFESALIRAGNVTLPAQFLTGTLAATKESKLRPLPRFRKHAEMATISLNYNYQNAVWTMPYGWVVDRVPLPSFAAKLAGITETPGKSYRIDYSLDSRTIPTFGASEILGGRVDPKLLAGKDVVVGTTSDELGDQYYIPGLGNDGGVYIHLFGAETLKSGIPADLGWIFPFLLGLIAAALGSLRRSVAQQNVIFTTTSAALLAVPYFLESNLIFVDVIPSLFVVACVAGSIGWRRFRLRGVVNTVSGLPNLNALRADRGARDRPLIVTRVHNYAEIASTLPPEDERLFVEQIVSRLSIGSTNRTLYQGDEGIFAWFADSDASMGDHLEALHALFRNPARIGKAQIDLAVSFGVESSGRSLANRIGSALVAADEAAAEGLKWKRYDPEKLKDVSWKLSLLSQLDAAIESGEVWVAYQPKLDLNSQAICGAEALARWTHPEKGPISPMEFIAAAEQHDRIEKLTYFVLNQAVEAAASVNARGMPFTIAVNLSARLLTDRNFPARVAELIKRHGLAAHRLTLELTETAALAGTGADLAVLVRLRDLGIKISIDDYGTGLSTLDYLKKIPASEIKIDQSFVKAIRENRSDWLMVQSTIALAHSLGQTVVAEGVEDRLTLDALSSMNCDIAQGFVIGRPTSFRSLMKRIQLDKKQAVA